MRVFCLVLFVLLAGCGQKGPLYYAPQDHALQDSTATDGTQNASQNDTRDDEDDNTPDNATQE